MSTQSIRNKINKLVSEAIENSSEIIKNDGITKIVLSYLSSDDLDEVLYPALADMCLKSAKGQVRSKVSAQASFGNFELPETIAIQSGFISIMKATLENLKEHKKNIVDNAEKIAASAKKEVAIITNIENLMVAEGATKVGDVVQLILFEDSVV